MVDVIPHVIGQTVPIPLNSIDSVPKQPTRECCHSSWPVQQLYSKCGKIQNTMVKVSDIDKDIIPARSGMRVTVEGCASVCNDGNISGTQWRYAMAMQPTLECGMLQSEFENASTLTNPSSFCPPQGACKAGSLHG